MLQILNDIDNQMLLAVNGCHSEFWDPIMFALSGRYIWIPLYVIIAVLLIYKLGWYRGILAVLAVGAAIGLSDYVCASIIRPEVMRYRPSNLLNPISPMVHIVNGMRSGAYGFPSCHAANSFALAVCSSFIMRNRWYTIFIIAWALLLCYTRMYLGVHYPGDLLVGAVIGSLIAWGVYLLYQNIAQKTSLHCNKKDRSDS